MGVREGQEMASQMRESLGYGLHKAGNLTVALLTSVLN
jgi:hypothetical protein